MRRALKSLVLMTMAIFQVVLVWADDQLFTLPLVGNDIVITAAWYYPDSFGGGLHRAIDYASNLGASQTTGRDILASYGGVIVELVENVADNTNDGGYGNYVRIDHGNGYETLYAHCLFNSVVVDLNDYVVQGQKIASVGNTGISSGPHLHFQIFYNDQPIDPYGWYDYPDTPNTYPNCNESEYYWTLNPPSGPNAVDLSRTLLNDLIVHVQGTPDYYWLRNGLMCHISSEHVFHSWGLNWDEAIEIGQNEFDGYELGPDVEVMVGAAVYDQNYQRWLFDYAADTSPIIVKRQIHNWQDLGYAEDIWIPVTNEFMNQFNNGDEVWSDLDYPYGSVLVNEDDLSERYVLVKGDIFGGNYIGQKCKLPLFSSDTYNLNYYHHNFNIAVNESILNHYLDSPDNTYRMIRDGKLITGSGPEIYYLEDGLKRHILDNISFNYYGFSYANVEEVGDDNLNAIESGLDIFFAPTGGVDIYLGGILEDGSFNSGSSSYWLFNDWQEISDLEIVTTDPVSGYFCAELNIEESREYYDVELKQLVEIEEDQIYHCSFYLKSDRENLVSLALQEDDSPWSNYGLWEEILATTNWQKHQYIFNTLNEDDLARFTFMLGTVNGQISLDEVIFEKVDNLESENNNLILNSSFDKHYWPWEMEDHYQLAQVYTDDFEFHSNSSAIFINPNQNGEYYEVQLKQLVNVEVGETYYLNFWARAESDRSLQLNLCRDTSPWDNYGLWANCNLSTDWQLYELQFTATQGGEARLSFNIGDQDSALWIDDVYLSTSFADVEENLILPMNLVSQNYPNPFNPETRISYSGLGVGGELQIYNVRGQMVKKLDLKSDQGFVIWNGRDDKKQLVSSGVYFYKLQDSQGRSLIRKMLLLK